MNEPLITIVVPVYKVPENYLHKCLKSIVAQTSSNFEALLIDDGSPDNCGDICDQYASRYSCFRVLHQKNGGLSVVRNEGVKNARGSWVCFVDGDDWIEPETIRFAEDYVKECQDGDVLIWDEYYDVGGSVKENLFVKDCGDGKKYMFSGKKKQYLVDMFFPICYQKFEKNYVDLGTANARLYKKKFLKDNNLKNVPGLRRMQDNVFNLWVIEKANIIYYQCKRLYHYTFNTEAATQKYAPDNVSTMNFLYECMRDYVRECHDTKDYYQRLYSRFLRIFGEIFKLNYANPDNPKKISERVRDARQAFSQSDFREVIENFDSSNQGRKTNWLHHLYLTENYYALIFYYSFSIRTRRIRLMLRG